MTSTRCCNCGGDGDGKGAQDIELCERCRKRFELQEKYEQNLLRVAEALKHKDYEGALAAIGATEAELGHLDADGWLRRSCMSDRGMVFLAQERWEEALAVFEARLQLPFEDPAERAGMWLDVALILVRLGRRPEARRCVDSALDWLEQSHPQAALPNLLRWLGNGEDTVFDGRNELVASALSAYKLEPPTTAADPVGRLKWARSVWRRND